MTLLEKFQEWSQENKSYVPSGVKDLDKVDFTPVSDRWQTRYALNALFSDYWIIGGQTGGSCWDEGDHCYTGISGEPEKEFSELNDFLEKYYPDLSFVEYRKLLQFVKYTEYTDDSDYYGNYTRAMVKYITLEDLEKIL